MVKAINAVRVFSNENGETPSKCQRPKRPSLTEHHRHLLNAFACIPLATLMPFQVVMVTSQTVPVISPPISPLILPMPSLPFSNPSFTSRLLVFYLSFIVVYFSFTSRLPAPSDKPVTADLNLPSDLSVNTATLQSPCINPYRSLFAARHFFVVAGSHSNNGSEWRLANSDWKTAAISDW
jgi:hypothetical protein